MATTNYERIGRALELLREGLRPFVEREMRATYGEGWRAKAAAVLRVDRERQNGEGEAHYDVQALFTLMWFQWNEVFATQLGHAERSLVSELRDVRNRWAHQQQFSSDDAYRALDSAARLLAAVSASAQAAELDRQKQELLRVRFEEQARQVTRRAAVAPTEGQPQAGLRPWREIITPHPDVAAGRYQQAEFAADLGQVHEGRAAPEYGDPREFFRRTFLTEGLRELLTNAVRRLSGTGGDPVVELQTNFGGGKTHSMLALYHLVSGTPAGELAGVEAITEAVGFPQAPRARRAVLVGTALSPSPSEESRKPDGILPQTLWGELAWQLGGAEGYALVKDADATGVSPGSAVLRALFERAAPCLVLIDEWVTFVRQLYRVEGLPAGSFDANMTFAQALTEAARQAPKTLVVASIPSSDIEKGGEGGIAATERLKNVFGRMESAWRPASAEEGFEIVRRRLFQPIAEPGAFAARDAVVRAFGDLYRAQPAAFPSSCREGDYRRRLEAAYPIHPELFDRLYNDWSTLDKFQRTRGVLRLMAKTIHELWERQDGSLLILPGMVPIAVAEVQSELTHYMDDPWVPVIEKDVDGPTSLPLALDRDNPNLGKYSACRRVARTLYLGSAPTLHTNRRGLDDLSLTLGCVQPGESVAVFGDALRRLTDNATHLYVDGRRYWLSTQPSVTRLAQDRAVQLDPDEVREEIVRRLRADRQRGDFAGVHTAPASSADVPDDMAARLVVLGPAHAHTGRAADSPALRAAQAILDSRGTAPRRYRNMLVFLAPDARRLAELEQAVRQYRAWASIQEDHKHETLNLDTFQARQAATKRQQAEETVESRMLETYTWALVPAQPDPTGPVRIEDERVQGQGPLAARVSRKLKELGLLTTRLAAAPLRLELDRYLWRDRDRLELKTLWGYLASYLYLPRLVNSDVLLDAVRDGLASLTWNPETFAYAQRHDPDAGRYVGLVAGQQAQVVLDDYSVIVKPEVAQRQLAEVVQPHPIGGGGVRPTGTGTGTGTATGGETPPVGGSGAAGPGVGPTPAAGPALAHRFYGAVELNPLRIGRDAGEIAQEVVQHLCTLPGATVRVRLEIEVEAPGGVPEDVVRTVSENSRVLNFATHEFEDYAATGEGQPHAADTGAESPHTPAVAAPQGRRTEE